MTEPIRARVIDSNLAPSADAELTMLLDYCSTLDGYADGKRTIDECIEIARNVELKGIVNSGLEDLSVAAFIWQRLFVWGNPEEQPAYERKIRLAIAEICKRQSN